MKSGELFPPPQTEEDAFYHVGFVNQADDFHLMVEVHGTNVAAVSALLDRDVKVKVLTLYCVVRAGTRRFQIAVLKSTKSSSQIFHVSFSTVQEFELTPEFKNLARYLPAINNEPSPP
jgi:hypothetical protein